MLGQLKEATNKEVGYYMQTPNNSNLQFPLTFQVIRSLLYMHVLLENVENKVAHGLMWIPTIRIQMLQMNT